MLADQLMLLPPNEVMTEDMFAKMRSSQRFELDSLLVAAADEIRTHNISAILKSKIVLPAPLTWIEHVWADRNLGKTGFTPGRRLDELVPKGMVISRVGVLCECTPEGIAMTLYYNSTFEGEN